jgi:ubiquinone/menaquinone biosynthesis C-methylase UbiE
MDSLEFINNIFKNESGVIIDIAGGTAPISRLINTDNYHYIVLDNRFYTIKPSSEKCLKILGEAENIPLTENSIDIAITMSCLQYFDQDLFFKECSRIIKPGGILALHENGAYNPIILMARLTQRILGLMNWKEWRYRNTIKKYYKVKELQGFQIVNIESKGLLLPLIFCFKYFGINLKRFEPRLRTIDSFIFGKLSFCKKMAFLNIVHYQKLK